MSNTFEQSVAAVAENRIGAEHPELSEYRRGFTLLDMDEDAQKAFGVYRFKLRDIPAMMPVVYTEGKIDGIDILIVYDFDLFVPAIDSWINYLLSTGKREIGKLVGRENRRAKGPSDVQMHLKDFPYALKTAETELTPAQCRALKSAFLPRGRNAVAPLLSRPTVSWLVPDSTEASYLVARTAQVSPEFRDRIIDTFGETFLNRARISASNLSEFSVLKKAEPEEPRVQVIGSIDDPAASKLKSHEKRMLLKKGQFIVDHRAETEAAVVYDTPDCLSLRTSPSAGIWDVLSTDGKLYTCAVRPLRRASYSSPEPYGIGMDAVYVDKDPSSPQELLVVSKEGEHTTVLGSDLYVMSSKEADFDLSNAGFSPTQEGLQKLWDEAVKRSADNMTISHASFPKAEKERRMHIGDTIVAGGSGAVILPGVCLLKNGKDEIQLSMQGASRDLPVQVDSKRKSTVITPGRVSIPENSVLIPDSYMFPAGFSFSFGRPSDIEKAVVRETGSRPLTVRLRNRAIKVEGLRKKASAEGPPEYYDFQGALQSGPLTENEAMAQMVLEGGLRPQSARTLLRKAASAEDGLCRCFIGKQAASVPELDVGMIQQRRARTNVTAADLGRLNEQSDRMAKKQNIAEQDSDEFTEDLTRKIMEVSDYRDIKADTVRALITAMNELGNLLLRILVHRDSYAEEYGEEDQENLEIGCRKNFIQIGDICIVLREKRGASGELDDDSVLDLASDDMG